MSFILSKILWGLANPGNFLVGLAVIALILLSLRRRNAARNCFIIIGLFLLALSFTPLSTWVLRPLENRFPQPVLPEKIDGIIVLGGAIDEHLSIARGQPQTNAAGGRVFAFIELAQHHPEAKLIYSGGTAALFDKTPREADIAAMLMRNLGLDASHVTFENQSRNTQENVEFSKKLVQPQPGEVWVVVTSAYQMPRTIGIFLKQDWPVIAYPVNYATYPTGHTIPWSLLEGLTNFHWAMREWLGLGYYAALGRTTSFFPGP